MGPTRYGPIDLEPDIITSLVEFERIYGDRQQLDFTDAGTMHNYMWHAVRAFFEEEGSGSMLRVCFGHLNQQVRPILARKKK